MCACVRSPLAEEATYLVVLLAALLSIMHIQGLCSFARDFDDILLTVSCGFADSICLSGTDTLGQRYTDEIEEQWSRQVGRDEVSAPDSLWFAFEYVGPPSFCLWTRFTSCQEANDQRFFSFEKMIRRQSTSLDFSQ